MTGIKTRTSPTPRLRDANAASEYIGGIKTARWLKDEARAGRIRHYRIGQTIAFDEADLDEYVASNFYDPANYGRGPR